MKAEMMMNGGGGGENAIKLNHHQQSTNQLLVVPAGNDGQPPPENGSLSCSSSTNSENGHNPNANGLNKPDLDYLGQLLKDKKQLAAFPNVFSHLERLVDDEINRVRIAIFQCEFSREPLQLPEAMGEVSIQQEKVFVPTKQFPDYNFVGRILGPRGMTAKQLEAETGCKIMVRGRGSMRDKKKEDMNRGKPNWEHLSEELHVIIQSEDTPNRNAVKIARAVEEVNKLLVPQPEGEDELKRKQLMELAIINGTFRNGAGTPSGGTGTTGIQTGKAGGAGATSLLQLDQRLLFANPVSLNSSAVAANLTGAPLILSTQSASHLVKNVATNPMPLAAAQPLSAAAAHQTQQQQQAALLQQLATMPNGILATPGPFGLALPQTSSALAGGGNQFDLLALSGQFQSQPQQFDASSAQLSALLQQQQLAILQQQTNGGIAFGEYANAAADSGVILSSQRRFVGHSRQEANPYGLPTTGSKHN